MFAFIYPNLTFIGLEKSKHLKEKEVHKKLKQMKGLIVKKMIKLRKEK